MEEIVDLIATDAAASDVSDMIKQALFNKASEKIDATRQSVGNMVFSETEPQED
jgi:hypothetical protein|tara:strand:- start:951 stop:1112 length:162 start_codon:yes stop_codon:yes gene_type:complete